MSDEVQKIAVDFLIEYFEKNEGFEKIYQEIELHKTTKTLFKSNVLSPSTILIVTVFNPLSPWFNASILKMWFPLLRNKGILFFVFSIV